WPVGQGHDGAAAGPPPRPISPKFRLDTPAIAGYVLGRLPKSRGSSRTVEDRFLDAAARLFRAKGFAATTVREIARERRRLPGSLHYRYPTKDSLLLALMKRGMNADLAGIRAAIRGTQDPVERLRRALRARLRYLLSRDAAQVVLFEWRALKGPARQEM